MECRSYWRAMHADCRGLEAVDENKLMLWVIAESLEREDVLAIHYTDSARLQPKWSSDRYFDNAMAITAQKFVLLIKLRKNVSLLLKDECLFGVW